MGYVRNFAQFLQKSFILKMFLFKCEHKSAVGLAVDFAVSISFATAFLSDSAQVPYVASLKTLMKIR